MGLIDEVNSFLTEIDQQGAINRYNLPQGTKLKPCVNALLSKPIITKGIRARETAGLYIATDLRDTGLTEGQIKQRLNIWNQRNTSPLPPEKIEGIIKSTYGLKPNGNYKINYKCNGSATELLQSEGACLNRNTCFYYQDNYVSKGYKAPPVNYKAMGYHRVLTANEKKVLYYIPILEKVKRVNPGDPLTPIRTSYRELNRYTDINQRFFKGILQALQDYGLISFIPGSQRHWEHIGTEITRIIPPPKIPVEFINKPKEFKQTIKKRRGNNGTDTTNIIPGQGNQSTAEA